MSNAKRVVEGGCCSMRWLKPSDLSLVKTRVTIVKSAAKKGSTALGRKPLLLVLICKGEFLSSPDRLRGPVLR